MQKISCIYCKTELRCDDVGKGDVIGAVYGGTIWRSSGNYGSGVYDPITRSGCVREFLELYLCDGCLVGQGKLVSKVTILTESQPVVEVTPFVEVDK